MGRLHYPVVVTIKEDKARDAPPVGLRDAKDVKTRILLRATDAEYRSVGAVETSGLLAPSSPRVRRRAPLRGPALNTDNKLVWATSRRVLHAPAANPAAEPATLRRPPTQPTSPTPARPGGGPRPPTQARPTPPPPTRAAAQLDASATRPSATRRPGRRDAGKKRPPSPLAQGVTLELTSRSVTDAQAQGDDVPGPGWVSSRRRTNVNPGSSG
jgi:hypothetical protein